MGGTMAEVLRQLDQLLAQRRAADPSQSYVAGLRQQGLNKMLEKVGEEAIEVILAAKDCSESGDQAALLAETADLWFHCMVVLDYLGSDSSAVLKELERRLGRSGLQRRATPDAGSE